MKRRDIEQKIYEEFNARKPELFQKILEQCPKMEQPVEKQTIWQKLQDRFSNRRFRYSFASMSVLVLLLFVVFGSSPSTTPQAYSTIAIEVNPSLVLELDDEDVVISVTATNEDALIILGTMDLVGVDSDVALNAIIGSMVINGYISEIANSVLLSIQSDDLTKEQELVTRLTQTISNLLSGSSINGSVITQTLDMSEDAKELAELLGISEAKAELILDIVAIDPRTSVDSLAKLSINDLNLLFEEKNYAFDNIKHVGSASTLGYITIEEAYQLALTHFNLDASSVIEYDIELEEEDGVLLYDIEIETNTMDYEILIDAKLGTIFDDFNNDDDDEDPIDEEVLNQILTEQEIITLISNQLGLNPSLMTEIELELEYKNQIVFFDVRFDYGELEYELELNAISGEIYSNSMDDSGYDFDDDEEDESDD